MVIVGGGALKGGHGAALKLADATSWCARSRTDGWNGFNVVHIAASRMGGLMLGCAQPGGIADVVAAKPKLAFFLGADEVDFAKFAAASRSIIGHHGDKGAQAADVVLPGASYAEKSGTWVNLEGRVQRGERAVFPPGDAREDWAILRALSERLGATLPFDSFEGLREAMLPGGARARATRGWRASTGPRPRSTRQVEGKVDGYPIKDFYLTNAICRASPTMQRCSAELVHGEDFAEAAE